MVLIDGFPHPLMSFLAFVRIKWFLFVVIFSSSIVSNSCTRLSRVTYLYSQHVYSHSHTTTQTSTMVANRKNATFCKLVSSLCSQVRSLIMLVWSCRLSFGAAELKLLDAAAVKYQQVSLSFYMAHAQLSIISVGLQSAANKIMGICELLNG